MKLQGWLVRNGVEVEDWDSEDIILHNFAKDNVDRLMVFISDNPPERDEDGFEEWLSFDTSNTFDLPKDEFPSIIWEDDPVKVNITIEKGE